MKILAKNNFKTWKKIRYFNSKKIIDQVIKSKLTGRGGANFPTGQKWKLSYPVEYLICNADESEPGKFKDKFILENNPEIVIEGIMIAMKALKAQKCYIYLRKEYQKFENKLKKIIFQNSPYDIQIVIGAGAYICGEETSILNSIEGKRGESRKKPPYPAEKGLYDQKTCVNNLETLARIPLIWDKNFDNDLMLFSISGDVIESLILEKKQGLKIGDLLEETTPINPKAIFFGASGGCLPYNKNLILSYSEIEKKGAFFEAGIIVVGQERSIPDICRSIIQFFNEENCGKCVPCREGNFRLLQLFQVIKKRKWTPEEFQMIQDLTEFIPNASQCGLGKFSTKHLQNAIKYFPEEFKKLCK
ncbi:hypothetical protein K8R66_01060 [bacterium]|nr:hypothetical protein [bacterium]